MEPVDRPKLSRFQPSAPSRMGLPQALRDPLRAGLVVAAVALAFGSISGWTQVWLPGRGWFEVSGFNGAGDGGITLEVALVLLALAWSERLSSSRLGIIVLAPFLLGVFALLDLRIALVNAFQYLDSLKNSGGYGYILPGYWLTVGGAALATAAGLIRVWRARHETRWTIGIGRATAAAAVGGVVGALGGFYAGVTIGQRITEGAIGGVTGSVLILLAIAFGFGGAWLGAWAGNIIGAPAQRS